jgi:hypothetical protein
MASSKKLTCKGTLRQVFICLRHRTHTHPPLHTVPIREYSILIHTGKVIGAIVHKAGSKNQHDKMYLQSINLINTYRKVTLQVHLF